MARRDSSPPRRDAGPSRRSDDAFDGRVVATRGRRVEVEDAHGARHVCFLSGLRAVVGDAVRWVPARGEGGKLIEVLPRRTVLARSDRGGREQVLGANLGGMLIVVSSAHPPYRPGLVDRYHVAASVGGLDVGIVLTKADLGVDDAVEADLVARASRGVPVWRVANPTGAGVDTVAAFLATTDPGAPWVLVGHSGVGKTSLIAALLPGEEVGPVGDISTFWDQGRHTTTGSRLFALPAGGVIADSPGIRTFLPGGLTPEVVRDHFPGVAGVRCRYRDCLHRDGEEGCAAPEEVDPDVLVRYRRLLDEVVGVVAHREP